MNQDHLMDKNTPPAESRLNLWGIQDSEAAHRNLNQIATLAGQHKFDAILSFLDVFLPRCPNADMALNHLERLMSRPPGLETLPRLLQDDARSLEIILQLFSASQYFSDLLIAHPEYLGMLRVPLQRSPRRAELEAHLQAELDGCFEDSAVLNAIRVFRQKQILRIATNDIIRDRPLEEVTRDISRVADAAVRIALTTALGTLSKRFGQPKTQRGVDARCVVLAFGKLGGQELNYSSDIDLMLVYDEEGQTVGRAPMANTEFYGRVVTELIRLLATHTDRGMAYRVDFRLRPEGSRGPLARSVASTLAYYDTMGRTWERQSLIKVRPIAGDTALGQEFLREIEPFVYRRYLSHAEINEIKVLKRRIETKTHKAGATDIEVKTGHGGIRDVEFTIQFLQLLNGGDLHSVRQRNTLKAIQALEDVGCLTAQEGMILQEGYSFLRKVEHRLQILFDLQTHRLPEQMEQQYLLARRMGYDDDDAGNSALDRFMTDYRNKTKLNRTILNHLLHDSFQDDTDTAEPESDLILAPDPDDATIQQTLGRYPFKDVPGAFYNLMRLAQESVQFLSPRRCRQFLASIAPRLLRALAETPDPDMALTNLEKVTASLGAKGILWELFSYSQPSLKLYVDLCAWSHFLSEILINSPGMIDELLDSLELNRPRSRAELQGELAGLCKGAADPDPILFSFRDKELLRIGVNDILGKEETSTTTAGLTDLAETVLAQIVEILMPGLTCRYGAPFLGDADGGPRLCRFVLLGLGKLGGREMGYSSDLDLILVYEGDGMTQPEDPGPPSTIKTSATIQSTNNFHFFSELAQRIIKKASHLGPRGRLYQVDMRLRPTGKSGSLVIPLAEFRRYFAEGQGQLWERLALTRTRVVSGDADFGQSVLEAVAEAAYGRPWEAKMADEAAHMRSRLEASRNERDLKRGFGGIVDIEFLVQLFQLKYASDSPRLRSANTRDALGVLHTEGLLPEQAFLELRENYDFLRRVESRLRIVHGMSHNELPEDHEDLEKLARRLGYEDGSATPSEAFLAEMEVRTKRTRNLFSKLLDQLRGDHQLQPTP